MRKEFDEMIDELDECLKTWHPGEPTWGWKHKEPALMEMDYPILINDKLVGISYYKPYKEGIKELGIVIKKEYQGKGLGTKGIKEILRMAKENGVKKMIAKVFNINKPMIHLMEKTGFEEYESKENYKMFEKILIIFLTLQI